MTWSLNSLATIKILLRNFKPNASMLFQGRERLKAGIEGLHKEKFEGVILNIEDDTVLFYLSYFNLFWFDKINFINKDVKYLDF